MSIFDGILTAIRRLDGEANSILNGIEHYVVGISDNHAQYAINGKTPLLPASEKIDLHKELTEGVRSVNRLIAILEADIEQIAKIESEGLGIMED